MRIYYAMEAEGLRHHVRSALGVHARAWNRLNRRVREWRQQLESRHGIPADLGIRPGELVSVPQSCACGCLPQPKPDQGVGVIAGVLRLIEDFAVESGGVCVTNVCLDKDDIPAFRRVSLDRLFNRINATEAQASGRAFVIFGQEPEEMITGLYHRLRSYNPVPTRHGTCDDGWHTRNLPIDRIIGDPAFRDPDGDCLLQVAGLVTHALLWQEEPPDAGGNSDGLAGAFGALDRTLNRRAARHDPQGVVRR
ncbi:MAG: hypothetical protein F4X66_17565 [Chloroflexi bacterium]|nr:hypothetical protein [Chloroflexota bacterium]MYE40450.1 hypothetical protein [Chloroflexota bacterium]